ncbi:MAG: 50S ribosomal protein L21 [bacterium]|nr:50S ribosomal protein L21 [bacterium]
MTTATATPKKTTRKAPAPKARTKPLAPRTSGLFATFATGGKQYRVAVGDLVKIEKLSDTHKEGDSLIFENVLLIDNGASEITLGTPFIKGSFVSATLNKIARYKTIDVIKYKQKSRYFKKYGHRQPYFEVKIDSIK